MTQTKMIRLRIGRLAVVALAFFACQKEILPVPASDVPSNAFESDMQLSKNAEKPGQYIKISEGLAIPDAVAVPEGSNRVATYYAKGVQQYKAQAVAGLLGVYQWVLVGPKADLYAHNNHLVGTHGTGPFWALSGADSIIGQHFAPARTAPSPAVASIDWLLLKPNAGTTPTGIFKDVRYIQRIATEGGKAPLLQPVSPGQTADVFYKAVYRFSN